MDLCRVNRVPRAMRGAAWQTKFGMVLIFSTLPLEKFISRTSGRTRTACIGLVVTLRLGGGALAFHGWRLNR